MYGLHGCFTGSGKLNEYLAERLHVMVKLVLLHSKAYTYDFVILGVYHCITRDLQQANAIFFRYVNSKIIQRTMLNPWLCSGKIMPHRSWSSLGPLPARAFIFVDT